MCPLAGAARCTTAATTPRAVRCTWSTSCPISGSATEGAPSAVSHTTFRQLAVPPSDADSRLPKRCPNAKCMYDVTTNNVTKCLFAKYKPFKNANVLVNSVLSKNIYQKCRVVFNYPLSESNVEKVLIRRLNTLKRKKVSIKCSKVQSNCKNEPTKIYSITR